MSMIFVMPIHARNLNEIMPMYVYLVSTIPVIDYLGNMRHYIYFTAAFCSLFVQRSPRLLLTIKITVGLQIKASTCAFPSAPSSQQL